ncbi:MAG TPA: helix-turn-helix domain-containing protein [Candidatus Faecisoma merdavium]|nr:helix-turn-helix domain-containing protein [Candidatus Faecisoma merdavium]
MKEIGEKLKEARENIGISIEEAAEDLKIDASQIINIENGEVEQFQDVFNLKYFIRDYAKYLGLNKEQIIDDFNEYLFDYTSKISLDDIKREKKIKNEDKIKSPYTIERKSEKIYQNFIYIAIVVLLITICVLLYTILNDNETEDNLVYGGTYELTK